MATDAERRAIATTAPRRRALFVLRRLHSLSGVLPLGVFLLEHLWTNAHALHGQAAFERAVMSIHALPLLPLIELFGIVLPLLFHAGFGLWLTKSSAPNVRAYPFGRNWAYLVQRVSGVLVLAFLCLHLWELRVQIWLFGLHPRALYATLAERLSSLTFGVPLLAFAYLLGLLATVLHFSGGLFGFCCTWGLAVSRPAQRRVLWASWLLGALLFVVGALVIVHFATGPFLSPP